MRDFAQISIALVIILVHFHSLASIGGRFVECVLALGFAFQDLTANFSGAFIARYSWGM